MKTRYIAIILGIVITSSVIGVLIFLDQPKTPWDCRMKYGKVKEDIQDCLNQLQVTEPKILENLYNNQPL